MFGIYFSLQIVPDIWRLTSRRGSLREVPYFLIQCNKVSQKLYNMSKVKFFPPAGHEVI
jgi:hypothetical protein